MKGQEHYREAERLLNQASDIDGNGNGNHYFLADSEADVAAAQVHATLALAAAQALVPVTQFMGDTDEVTEWGRIVGHNKVTAVSS